MPPLFFPMSHSSLRRAALATALALCGLGLAAQAETVALGLFSHADFERNDPDTTAAIATVVQSGLESNPAFKFVERNEAERLCEELGLSRQGLVLAETQSRVGRLLKADLLLSGTFFTPKGAKPYVILEVNELARAEPIGQSKVELEGILDKGHLVVPTAPEVRKIVEAGSRLLDQAAQQLAAQRDRTTVKLLFVSNQTGDPSLTGFGRMVSTQLGQAVKGNPSYRLLRIERPEVATRESELALLGLAEADRSAWAQVANYYVWGDYRIASGTLTLTLNVWNGRKPPVTVVETAPIDGMPLLASKMAKSVLAAAAPADAAPGPDAAGDQRSMVATLLSKQADELRTQALRTKLSNEEQRANLAEQRGLLATAVFFAPEVNRLWLDLMDRRLTGVGRPSNDAELLRSVGNLAYGLEVLDRCLVLPAGQVDPQALLGVMSGSGLAAQDRFSNLMDDFSRYQEDLRDAYAGRNLLALKERVALGYRRSIRLMGRRLTAEGVSLDDNFRAAGEFIAMTTLLNEFPDAECDEIISGLWPRLKPCVFAHRAWYPTGDRLPVERELRRHWIAHGKARVADAQAELSPAELEQALKIAPPSRSPGGEKLMMMSMTERQINSPGFAKAPPAFIAQRKKDLETMRGDYDSLKERAALALKARTAGTNVANLDFNALTHGVVSDQITMFQTPLDAIPQASRPQVARWLRDTADQRQQEGYPAAALDRMRAQAERWEREATAPAATPAGQSGPVRNPSYLDPKMASFLLVSSAERGDIPSLQALFNLGAPPCAAGAALVAAIHNEQWPTAYFLLARGYDPMAPWPDMDFRTENLSWSEHPARLALAAAAVKGRKDLLEELLKRGVHFDSRSNSGAYAVLELTKSSHAGPLQKVLAAQARADRHLDGELEPLGLAIAQRDLEVLRLLLGAGADPTRSLGKAVTSSPGLSAMPAWASADTEQVSENALEYCARSNWLPGVQALLGSSHANLRHSLSTRLPHAKATDKAVRAEFVRAELLAMGQDDGSVSPASVELFAAIAAGDALSFKAALAKPESLQVRGFRGESALMFACEEKQHEFAEQLLAAGASITDTDSDGLTPLAAAARSGNVALVERMVKMGANLNEYHKQASRPLDLVLDAGSDSAMALKLLSLGAEVGADPRDADLYPLWTAARNNMVEVVQELIQRGADPHRFGTEGISVFFPVARSNNPDLIQRFVDAGCDLRKRSNDDWTPLMTAVRWGAPASVRKLLELGLRDNHAAELSVALTQDMEPANHPNPAMLRHLHYRPDYRRCMEIMDEFGQLTGSRSAQDSIFWHATHAPEEIDAYLAAGGTVNYRGTRTPLQDAIGVGNRPLVALLLAKKANPNLVGTGAHSDTPLQLALRDPVLVEILLRHGANPNAVSGDSSGSTMLTLACLDINVPLDSIRLLVRYGGDPAIDARAMLARYGEKNDPRGLENVSAALNGL